MALNPTQADDAATRVASVGVDEHVLAWFKRSGPRFETRINAVLRAYLALPASKLISKPAQRSTQQLIALPLDPHVLDAFRHEAARRGLVFGTLINHVLARHVRAHRV